MTDPMPPADPRSGVQRDAQNRPLCGARTRAGASCRQPAMRGGFRCRMHGGASPQAKRKARLRLAELVDPAIATIARVMVSGAKDADRLRAAEAILDRAGHPRASRIEGHISVEDARETLIERLLELRAVTSAERPALPRGEVVVAEIVGSDGTGDRIP